MIAGTGHHCVDYSGRVRMHKEDASLLRKPAESGFQRQ
jgi:hypothetical protein